MRRWIQGLLLAVGMAGAGVMPADAQEASVAWRPWQVVAPPELPDGYASFAGRGVVVWASPDRVRVAERLRRHAETSLPSFADQMGLPVGGDVHIVLTETEAEFRDLQPGAPPQWADATAWPGRGVVYLRQPGLRAGDADPLEQVLDHELVHIVIGRAFAPAAAPRWLQEGMAQVLSGEIGPEHATRMAQEALAGGAPSLAALTASFPDDPHRADAAYALSADFVLWLDGTYGEGTMRSVVQRVAHGQPPRAALFDATGASLDELDAAWGNRLRSFWGPLWASAQLEPALWGLVSLGLLWTGAKRRVSRTRSFTDWREERAQLARLTRELLARRSGRQPLL